MNSVGQCYQRGEGTPQCPKRAVFWFKKAMDKGHAQATFNMAQCLRDGFGVAADPHEAARLFQLANDLGCDCPTLPHSP